MYRQPPIALFDVLSARLTPMGFVALERKWLHRKTWNTNRGVVLSSLRATSELGDAVARLREEAKSRLAHSWWSQLGLQIVFELEAGALPPQELIALLVDQINSQGVLIQSIFVLDPTTHETREARTWGQLITGKFQDAIAAALADFASHDSTR